MDGCLPLKLKNLGVIFDKPLTFKSQINSITLKGYKNVGFVTRYYQDMSVADYKLIFFGKTDISVCISCMASFL